MTIVRLVLVAIVLGGCSVAMNASPSADASPPTSSASLSSGPSGSAALLRPLPSAFPLIPDAVSVPMPQDDPGLIARWESDRVGSAAYDFYVAALPAAGYPIVGLYPGGEVAVIRFGMADGQVWQMVARGTGDGRVAIEIRVDRP